MKKPQSIATLVEKLMTPIVQDHGAMTYVLLTQWARIMGDDLAERTQVQRLMWARKDANGEQSPATLLIHVSDGGTALQVQQSSPQILERINALYGWKAVSSLKIKQVLTLQQAPSKPKPIDVSQDVREKVEQIVSQDGDAELRAMLLRLGNSIFSLESTPKPPHK